MDQSEIRAITDDIDKVAKDIAGGGLSPLRLYLSVAKAILTERERCAKIAECFDPGAYCQTIPEALDSCAAAIRHQEPSK